MKCQATSVIASILNKQIFIYDSMNKLIIIMNVITTISSSVLSSGWFHMVTTYMCVLSHCLYLMETNLSQIIVYNPMGEFFIYIYIFWGVGEDIPSGASLWIFYCKGCVTVNLSGCYRRGKIIWQGPRTISLLKLGFHISGKSQGIRYFSFSWPFQILLIYWIVTRIHSQILPILNWWEMEDEPGGLEPRNLEGW